MSTKWRRDGPSSDVPRPGLVAIVAEDFVMTCLPLSLVICHGITIEEGREILGFTASIRVGESLCENSDFFPGTNDVAFNACLKAGEAIIEQRVRLMSTLA